MKLRNKKTREIGWLYCDYISIPKKMTVFAEDKDLSANHWDYTSLAELNAEWEDYEETKEFWFIDEEGIIRSTKEENWPEESVVAAKSIGNYFEPKEEAEKAVEKLKIYNKLKQKGFVFSGWYYSTEGQLVILADNHEFSETEPEDLTELFGDKIC